MNVLRTWLNKALGHAAVLVARRKPLGTERRCIKCNKPVTWRDDEDGGDWWAADDTTCGADVTYDVSGDPVIGHHDPAGTP